MKYEDFVKRELANFEGLVVDVGCGSRGKNDYQLFLGGSSVFVRVDSDPFCNPDVVACAEDLPFDDGGVDGVLCISVLEHVDDPGVVVEELRRVLRPGGFVLVHVPTYHPFHGKVGVYRDNRRFFKDGLLLLFGGFSEVKIEPLGGLFEVAVNFVCPNKTLRRIAHKFDNWFNTRDGNVVTGYFVLAKK